MARWSLTAAGLNLETALAELPDIRASARPHLKTIRVPALLLNARNVPMVPGASLPGPHEVGANVTLWQPEAGRHVGFPAGGFPGHVHTMPEAVCE